MSTDTNAGGWPNADKPGRAIAHWRRELAAFALARAEAGQ